MEPPTKRRRMSRGEQPKYRRSLANLEEEQAQKHHILFPPSHGLDQHNLAKPTPTPTIDLSEFRPQAQGHIRKRTSTSYLVPRAPDVTVTANIVNVAVTGDLGVESTLVTAQTSDAVIEIASLGSLTVPGVAAVIKIASVSGTESTQTPLGLASSDGSVATSALPTNVTSSITSSERTVTVTSTSSLLITYNNGTFIAPSRSTGSQTPQTLTEWRFGDASGGLSSLTTPTNDGYAVGGAAATSSSANTATTSAGSGSNDTGPGVVLTPQQQQVVGGVVGGVAGIAFVLAALLYFLKWYRHRLTAQGRLPGQLAVRHDYDDGNDRALIRSTPMEESSMNTRTPIAAFASRLKQFRPQSTITLSSTNTTRSSTAAPESERSFQKLGGRKIPSVLSSGGDGYGGNYGCFDANQTRSPPMQYPNEASPRNSWYDDNNGLDSTTLPIENRPNSMSAPGTPTMNPFNDPPMPFNHGSRSPPSISTVSTRDFAFNLNQSRSNMSLRGTLPSNLVPHAMPTSLRGAEGYAALRPSPARTPVTLSPTNNSFTLTQPVSTPPLLSDDVPDLPPVPRMDLPPNSKKLEEALARSLASMETNSVAGSRSVSGISGRSGSTRGGRFREEI